MSCLEIWSVDRDDEEKREEAEPDECAMVRWCVGLWKQMGSQVRGMRQGAETRMEEQRGRKVDADGDWVESRIKGRRVCATIACWRRSMGRTVSRVRVGEARSSISRCSEERGPQEGRGKGGLH